MFCLKLLQDMWVDVAHVSIACDVFEKVLNSSAFPGAHHVSELPGWEDVGVLHPVWVLQTSALCTAPAIIAVKGNEFTSQLVLSEDNPKILMDITTSEKWTHTLIYRSEMALIHKLGSTYSSAGLFLNRIWSPLLFVRFSSFGSFLAFLIGALLRLSISSKGSCFTTMLAVPRVNGSDFTWWGETLLAKLKMNFMRHSHGLRLSFRHDSLPPSCRLRHEISLWERFKSGKSSRRKHLNAF